MTHLKAFQVPGKLGLFRFLHVQLLYQLLGAPAVLSFVGLLLWSPGGRGSQSPQDSVQHVELWGTKGAGPHQPVALEAHREEGLEKGEEGNLGSKSREKSSLIKL